MGCISAKASKDTVAIKIVSRDNLSPEDEKSVKDEVAVLSSLNHPHIIRLYDFFATDPAYYLILELCNGGELFDKIAQKKAYTEKEARDLCKILLGAIAYCHDHKVVHRDLKPENLLLTSSNDVSSIKIADFGLAEKLDKPNSLKAFCGSPSYVAPEVLKEEYYGLAVDNWSIGVIVYILLGGYPPFSAPTQEALYELIKKGEYEFHSPHWDHISEGAKEMISGLLTVDPAKRMTAKEALNHDWMTEPDQLLLKRDLHGSLISLRVFNAKRKFRAGVEAVKLSNHLLKKFSSLVTDDSATNAGGAAGEEIKVGDAL